MKELIPTQKGRHDALIDVKVERSVNNVNKHDFAAFKGVKHPTWRKIPLKVAPYLYNTKPNHEGGCPPFRKTNFNFNLYA